MKKKIAYLNTRAHEKLAVKAASPYDLTAPGALQNQDRLSRYTCSSRMFSLYYSSQRVDDKVLDGLQELADELGLIDQFIEMKGGAMMNSISGVDSEDR